MKVFLIRHGQTTGDIEDRYGGEYDDHLTALGQTQAEELAKKLVGQGIAVMLCSPKLRAQETALTLNNKLQVEIKDLPSLAERDQYGVLSGLTRAEAQLKYPQMAEEVKDFHNTIEGAETYKDFCERIREVWDDITGRAQTTVAVLTHGGPIRVIFREILKLGEIDVADCGFAVLEVSDDEIKITQLDGIHQRTD